jgi:hypothetical protein
MTRAQQATGIKAEDRKIALRKVSTTGEDVFAIIRNNNLECVANLSLVIMNVQSSYNLVWHKEDK